MAILAYAAGTGAHVHPLVAGTVAVVGAACGGLFGRLSRRLFRPGLRVFWAAAVATSFWLLLYAFLLMRLLPAGALSFLHTVPCVALYGICVGAMPPLRARSEHGRNA
jgi:hypothetical protein